MREKQILKVSMIGILVNACLAALKAFIGILSGSIAITLDAINNLKDAVSSVITIVGIRLAARPADKKHPYGYGRIEYLCSMVVAGIILLAGVNFCITSVDGILHPAETHYSLIPMLILVVAVGVKMMLGRYTLNVGKQVESQSLVASGKEALFDVLISCSTLVCAGVSIVWKISLDGILGTVISLGIIYSGIEILRDTISSILEQRVDSELAKKIKMEISEEPGVVGTYDLILHNYGPEKVMGSVHVELYDSMTLKQAYDVTKRIQRKIMELHDILLTVGIYSVNTQSDATTDMAQDIRQLVMGHEGILQMHALYIDLPGKEITFDIVIDLAYQDKLELRNRIVKEMEKAYPGYDIGVVLDTDFSD